ncbi:MAG: rhomboid family intramembrane serine protease [Anaerolineae bacterium]
MDVYPSASEPVPEPPPSLHLRLPLYPLRLTYVLIAVNILAFFITRALGSLAYYLGGLSPAAVLHYGQLWRLVTSGFMHADVSHLGFNMYALYLFGRQVERYFGPRRFAMIYGGALLGSSSIVVLLSELKGSTVGASGAVLGLLGALMIYVWRYQEGIAGARAHLGNLLVIALVNLGIGLLPRVSLWGHLGGILAGVGVGWATLPHYEPVYSPTLHLKIAARRKAEWGGLLITVGVCVLLLLAAGWLRR